MKKKLTSDAIQNFLGLTLKEFAGCLGISYVYLLKIRTRDRRHTFTVIERLDALRTAVSEQMEKEESETHEPTPLPVLSRSAVVAQQQRVRKLLTKQQELIAGMKSAYGESELYIRRIEALKIFPMQTEKQKLTFQLWKKEATNRWMDARESFDTATYYNALAKEAALTAELQYWSTL